MQLGRTLAAALLAATACAQINTYEREAAPGPALGTCQYIKEGAAEMYLCLKKAQNTGGDRQVVEGLIYNSGTKALCDIKLKPVGVQGTIENFWPTWAVSEGKDDDDMLPPDQVADLGMTIQLEQEDAPFPTIGAVSFGVCGGGDKMDPINTRLTTVKITDVKFPQGTGIADPEQDGKKGKDNKPNNNNNQQQQQVAKPAAKKVPQAQQDGNKMLDGDKMIEVVKEPIVAGPAAGECQYFHQGTAELVYCTEKAEAAGDKQKLVQGILFNNGTTDLCNVQVAAAGTDGAGVNIWPDYFVNPEAAKEPFVLQSKAKVDVGMTAAIAPGTDPSIIIKNFQVCGGGDGLKKDTPVVTVPYASVDVGKKKGKKDKKGKIAAAAPDDDGPGADAANPVEAPTPAAPAPAPAADAATAAPAAPAPEAPPAAPTEEVPPEQIGGNFAPNGQRLPSPKKPSTIRYLRA